MSLREQLLASLQEIMEELDGPLEKPLDGSSPIDSLGLAMLVVSLKDRLGFDPFGLSKDRESPKTIDELIAVYERYQATQQANAGAEQAT